MIEPFNPYNVSDQGTVPTGNYANPSTPSNLNPTFGESDQFNIPGGAIKPFNFEQQRAENANFLGGFSNFLGNQETLPAIQQRYENRFGIPDLQENYLRQKEATEMVGNQIQGLPQSVNQRTNESLMTQGQIDRVVNKEAKDLLEVYNGLGQITESTGRRLAMAEQNLNNAAKLEMAQLERDQQPWLMGYDLMNLMQAREMVGWTTTQSLELNRLLANQSAGLTWTDNEAQRAHDLSVAEKGFQNALDQISATGEQSRLTKKAPGNLSDLWSSVMG